MISEELRKYLDMVNEEFNSGILYEMVSLDSDDHGIQNVIIWVGKTNKRHGPRVKVSNIPNTWSDDENFTITIPMLDYDPDQVARWIKKDTMHRILEWIKLNQKLIYKLENGEYSSTKKFLNDISKV